MLKERLACVTRETKASLRSAWSSWSWGGVGLELSASLITIWCLFRRCLQKLLVTSELYVSQCLQYKIFFLPLWEGSFPIASRVWAQVWIAEIPLVLFGRADSLEWIKEDRSVSEAIDSIAKQFGNYYYNLQACKELRDKNCVTSLKKHNWYLFRRNKTLYIHFKGLSMRDPAVTTQKE